MADDAVEGVLAQWAHVHEMTIAFLDITPDEYWQFTPHPRFAPFAKQARHVVGVRGVYIDAMRSGRLDFSRKHEYYTGRLERGLLNAALTGQHKTLFEAARDVAADPAWRVDCFGTRVPLAHFLAKLIQHEAIHHGEWSVYASFAGFETPALWQANWGL